MQLPGPQSTKGAIAFVIWLSWVVCSVGATSTSTSRHTDAHNNKNQTGNHRPHHAPDSTYNRLRSASSSAKEPSPADDHASAALDDIREMVLFLSQKIDDSDARINSLEKKVRAQRATIKKLETDVNDATSFHRYLQSDDNDCLPRFRRTLSGPRCEFKHVIRFRNRTIFNDDAVFNENVEFGNDADCMPQFNSTTRMCSYNNNFTFAGGKTNFREDVRFSDTVKFDGDASFRDHVEMRSDVDFSGSRGDVGFHKPVKFTENVMIQNDSHEIEFKLLDKVKVKFYQDRSFEVDTHMTLYQDVDLKKDLEIDGTLRVHKKSKLDDLELYGYLWVHGYTVLEGTLEVKKQTTMKDRLKVESGGLEVSSHGAHISGTSTLNGDFKLYGNGFVNDDFNVDRKLTASSVLIQHTNSISRNLQQNSHPAPTPAPAPRLEVRGDANFDGTLVADRIRSDDINGQININDVVHKVKAEFRGETVVFGDVRVVNNFVEEQVMTQSRMINSLRSATLSVDRLIANGAVLDGTPFPGTTDEFSNYVIGALKNKNVDVNSLTASRATIGGRSYPHKDPSSDPVKVNIEDIVSNLGLYEGKVLIPNLNSIKLDMVKSITKDMEIIKPKLRVDGIDVALMTHINDLNNKINDLEDSAASARGGMSQDEIVRVLAGASLSVSSLDTSSLKKSSTDVPNVEEVNNIFSNSFVYEPSPPTCTCDRSIIESVVTTDYVRGRVDAGYVDSLGFMTQDDLNGFSSSGDCTCSESDVRSNIDTSFLESLGVSFTSDIPDGCTCSTGDIRGAVDNSYIQDAINQLGISTGGSSCTCSSDDISRVVDRSYIANLGFLDEVPGGSDCVCDIEGVVTKDYISKFGFLDKCPCESGFIFSP